MGTNRHAAIFTGGRPVYLPDHRNGWCWEPYAVDGADVEAAPQQFQHLMRDAEADIAEALSNASWVTMVDGPLRASGTRRGLAIHRLREEASPTHARPRALGQGCRS